MAIETIPEYNPIAFFASVSALSSFAGLAALLRSGGQITKIAILSAAINSGLIGLVIATIFYTRFQDNIFMLVGMSILSGLGGNTAIDFILQIAKRMVSNKFGVNDGGSDVKPPIS